MSDFVMNNGVLEKYTGNGGDVVIPDGVTSIGHAAFMNNSSLKSVTIPGSVTSIGNKAFQGCTILTSITIPDSVTSIGRSAFFRCSRLQSITIPDSVMSIGRQAFLGCNRLMSITIPNNVTSIGDSLFYKCNRLQSITIPDGVTSIGGEAFCECKQLMCITLPDSVTSIGDRAFSECTKLMSITIPGSVTSIGDSMFYACKSLKSITIPSEVTSIGNEAFYQCKMLKSITIPGSVTSIGDRAFSECTKLMSITIPDSVTSIGNHVFSFCGNLKSITIPNNVTSIGIAAFRGCERLTSITIPDSVTSIGDWAFLGCSSLTSITIPDGVTSIGNEAFNECSSLTSITISNPTVSIGEQAFMKCVSLTSVSFAGNTVMDESAFGDSLPVGLIGSVKTLYAHLTDGALKHYYADRDFWKQQPDDLKYEIFRSRQSKTLSPWYLAVFQKSDFQSIAVRIEKELTTTPGKAIIDASCNFMLKYAAFVDHTTLKKLFAAIQNIEGSATILKKLKADKLLMSLLRKTDDESLPSQPLGPSNLAVRKLNEYFSMPNRTQPSDDVVNNLITMLKSFLIRFADDSPVNDYETVAKVIALYYRQASFHIHYIGGDLSKIPVFNPYYTQDESLDHIVSFYSIDSILSALEKRLFNPKYRLILPFYARFVHGVFLDDFLKLIKLNQKGRACDRYWSQNARACLTLNDELATLLFMDQNKLLDSYASCRGTTAEILRNTRLADTGLDAQGKRTFDTGITEIVATLQPDFTLSLFDQKANKVVKSIPKKGVDEAKYEEVKTALAGLKRNIRSLAKNRVQLLFQAFLKDEAIEAKTWRTIYLGNPVFRQLAELLVWTQSGVSFTLRAQQTFDVDGQPVELNDRPIRLAHPMEMTADSIQAWQQYFLTNHLKQPFTQIWQPVVRPESVRPDRYKGVRIPLFRFSGQQKHGIKLNIEKEYAYWMNTSVITQASVILTDCTLYIDGIEDKNASMKKFVG